MPVYEYRCDECVNQFTAMGSINTYQAPADCPECGKPAPRVIGSAPQLNTMNPSRRKAFQVNEQSAHAPRTRNKHTCSSSCGCGTSSEKPQTNADGTPKIKAQNGKRPWMLGH